MTRNMRGDRASVRVARMVGSSVRRKPIPWRTAIPRSSMKARIWLMMPVRCDTSRSRTRCNACRSSCSAVLVTTNFIVGRCTASAIASASLKSFFCPLLIGANIFGRHQPGIVTKRREFAAQVMCADAGFHADQARWYVGEPRFHLATRPLLPQHDGAARIVAHDVERVLADIDADHGGDCALELLGHGVLLVFGAPSQHSIAGREGAWPDHPISGRCRAGRTGPFCEASSDRRSTIASQ